jgi:hypothetical protein
MSKVKLSVVAAFVLLAFSVAFAASNSTQINLGSAATVAGQKLAPGNYRVSWTGEGDNVTVTFKGKDGSITAPAKATKGASAASTSVVTNKDGEVTEIRPGGKSTSLNFSTAQSASMNNSGSSSSQ